MAGGKERILRRRIKSVQSTKKITKAMELIAASKIVKAQQRVAASRPYADQITEVIRNLAAAGAGGNSPLLSPRDEIKNVCIVAMAGDRGLCGGYNTNVIRTAERALNALKAEGKQAHIVVVGKKVESYFRFRGLEIEAGHQGFTDEPGYEDARAVAASVVGKFEDGTYDRVDVIYTQFETVGNQTVVSRQFLPLDTSAITADADGQGAGLTADYEFEPAPDAILERLLPRYAESRMFAALLDGAASEHAARQRAMKSATDNAEELITKLSRAMNRARQDSITTEIMEIVSGAEALRAGGDGGMDLLPDNALASRDLLPDLAALHDTRHHI